MPGPRKRPFIALVAGLAAVAVFAGVLAWLLDTPKPPPGAGRPERLYYAFCATCHGRDGRGAWSAVLFLVRPGDLTDQARLGRYSDQYLFDLIKHGGAPIGRPGMPAFGTQLSDEDIQALVRHVRQLGRSQGSLGSRLALDPQQEELIALRPDRQPDAIAWLEPTPVE